MESVDFDQRSTENEITTNRCSVADISVSSRQKGAKVTGIQRSQSSGVIGLYKSESLISTPNEKLFCE
jgi:hypothetical protein